MVVALSLCDEVVAYGMNDNPNVDPDEVPYHYYQPDRPNIKTSEINQARRWHRSFDAERDLWRRLAINPVEEILQDKVVLQGFSHCDADSADSKWKTDDSADSKWKTDAQVEADSQDVQSGAATSSHQKVPHQSKKSIHKDTATTTLGPEANSAWNPFR